MQITMMILCLNIMFLFMKHPMSMGLMLISQTIMVALCTGIMSKTFWMSYIMVIIILSGMLVLFIYMASIASNEKFKNNKKMWLSITSLMTMLIFGSKMLKFEMMKKSILSMNSLQFMKSSETLFLQKMFNSENMYITILMMSYLFYTMIVVNYMVNIHEGSMKITYKNSYE